MQETNREYWILMKMWNIRSEIRFMSNEYRLSNAYWDIWKIVRRQLRQDEDVAVENIFSILPLEVQDIIKRHLILAKLKTVPMLQDVDQKVSDAILRHLEQVNYTRGSYIIREGEPLDMMIFVTRGNLLTYNTNTGHGGGGSGLSNTIGRLAGGDVYGEEVITWAVTSTSFFDLPISTKTLKSHNKVEVFTIMASDLQLIVSEFSQFFSAQNSPTQLIVLLPEIPDGNL